MVNKYMKKMVSVFIHKRNRSVLNMIVSEIPKKQSPGLLSLNGFSRNTLIIILETILLLTSVCTSELSCY
jgi:hypothetical protein